MTLQFERAGTVEVKVVVRGAAAPAAAACACTCTERLRAQCEPGRYLASARSASLMPAATSTSAGSVFSVADASRSL